MVRKARALVSGRTRADYDNDEALRLALTHLLQVIGEAARRVAPESRATCPVVPWAAIIGMRHRVVHDYMFVNEGVVWETVIQDLPALIAALEPLLPPEEPAP